MPTLRAAIEAFDVYLLSRAPANPVAWLAVRPPAAKTVFCADDGSALTVSGLRQLLKRLGRRAGVARCNPHSFRHAFALGYLRRGGSLAELSKLMGHAQIATTIVNYVQFERSHLRDAHEQYSPINDLREDITNDRTE